MLRINRLTVPGGAGKSVIWLLLALFAVPVWADDFIEAIRFVGNDKTKERILLQEMVIKTGDLADPVRIEKSRQGIANLGLFKSVNAELLGEGEGKTLQITVEEKFYILPFPLLDVRPEGNYSYGVELRLDNLAGLNQRLKLTYEDKRDIDDENVAAKQFGLTYAYPRIVGTPYSLGLNMKMVEEDVDGEDDGYPDTFYELDYQQFSIGVSRWLNSEGVTGGWYTGWGFGWLNKDYRYLQGVTDAYESGQQMTLNGTVGYRDVQDHIFFHSGKQYSYNMSVALPQLGSDYSFNTHVLNYTRYLPLLSAKSNFDAKVQLGLANGEVFGNPLFGIGGHGSVRGYDGGYKEGNFMATVNMEYLHQISGFQQLRALVFTDIGSAWQSIEDVGSDNWIAGAGFGLRWRVQSFVDMNLSLETAYGLDTEEWRTYFSTSGGF